MVVLDRPITLARADKPCEHSLEERLEELSLEQLGDLFRERWEGLETLGHKTHTTAYDIGLVLERVRSQCPRGAWLEWVDEQSGIARRTAQRYIKFRELVGERANLDELDGSWGIVEAIAKLTPERQPGPEDEVQPTPVATPRDIVIEQLDAGHLTQLQLGRWEGLGDLLVTSWPYGLGIGEHGYVDFSDTQQWEFAAGHWIDTLRQVLAPNGRVCLNLPFDTRLGGTPYPIVATAIRLFEQRGFKYRQHHVWPKAEGGQTSRSTARGSAGPRGKGGTPPTPNAPAAITGVEEVLVFHQGEWNLGRAGDASDMTDEEAIRFTNAFMEGVPTAQDRAYPCVMSHELAELLIKLYTFPLKSSGERSVVMDFHCGRGTSARASMRLGRAFVGGDINPYAVALATRNIQAAYLESAGAAA